MLPFRIWDKNSKKMIYPRSNDILEVYDDGTWEFHTDVYISSDSCRDYYETVIFDDDGTLLWGIGRKDSNGRKVYEGDVVEAEVRFITEYPFGKTTEEKIVGVVEKTDDGCWQIRTNNKYMPIIGSCAAVQIIKVIGNIYENPELLKGR